MVELRELTLDDKVSWLDMRNQLWPGHIEGEMVAELTAIATSDAQTAFGAFEGATMVGFAECNLRAYGDGFETAPVPWLEGIYVSASHRRAGVGKLLVEAVADWARARGHSELGSDAAIYNTASHQSHAAWGFEEIERIVLFRRKLT